MEKCCRNGRAVNRKAFPDLRTSVWPSRMAVVSDEDEPFAQPAWNSTGTSDEKSLLLLGGGLKATWRPRNSAFGVCLGKKDLAGQPKSARIFVVQGGSQPINHKF